jgi:prepilin-type N-terminal cleavage/methylation domain-containing protein
MIQNRKGFTLIELLIVVVIIGILAAIAIPKFANTKNKAYVTAMKADLHNLTTAEESFFADSTHYADYAALGSARFQPSSGVAAPTIATGAGYWFATVTHSQLTGYVCGIAYGTTNPTVAGTSDGEPICK